VITKKLKAQIDFLHRKCGKFEWSGELITREEGSVESLDDWKIICEDVYLVDIGTSAYTEYEVNKGGFKAVDIIEMYEQFPGLLENTHKNQHIHSHQSMKTFFSSTDSENLHDRAIASNYFMMLIVNFDGEYCAKVAFKAKQARKGNTTLTLANNSDGYKPIKLVGGEDQEVLVVCDCTIEYNYEEVEESFSKRYEEIRKIVEEEKAKKALAKPVQGHLYNSYNSKGSSTNYDDFDWDEKGKIWHPKDKKSKRIGEMTKKEFEEYEKEVVGSGWELRHVRTVINSVLDGVPNEYGFHDPIPKLAEKSKELSSVHKMEEYIMEFSADFKEKFDTIYPYKNTDDHWADFLEITREFLLPYKYLRLVKEILDDVEFELMEYWPKKSIL
jgi:hypothetical protein